MKSKSNEMSSMAIIILDRVKQNELLSQPSQASPCRDSRATEGELYHLNGTVVAKNYRFMLCKLTPIMPMEPLRSYIHNY